MKMLISLIILACFLVGFGLLVWADWRIALGVFLVLSANNMERSSKKYA